VFLRSFKDHVINIGPSEEITSLTFEILQRDLKPFDPPRKVVLTETATLPISMIEARDLNNPFTAVMDTFMTQCAKHRTKVDPEARANWISSFLSGNTGPHNQWTPQEIHDGIAKAEGGTSSYPHGLLVAGYPWEITCERPGMQEECIYGKD